MLYIDSSVWRSFRVRLIQIRVLGIIRHCIHKVQLGHYHDVIEVEVQEAMEIL